MIQSVIMGIPKTFKNLSGNIKKIVRDDLGEIDPDALIHDVLESGFEGDYEQSLEILDEGIEFLDENPQETEFKIKYWKYRAMALLKLGKAEEALDCINKAIEHDDKDPDLWSYKEEILHDLGKYDESLDAITNQIKLLPEESKSQALSTKAHTLGHLEKHEEALELFEKSLQNDPTDIQSWYGKSEELYDLGKMEESLKACEEGLKIDYNDVDLLFQKGLILLEQNKIEAALSIFEKTSLMEPSDDSSWYNKASALSLLNKKDAALDALTVAIGLDSDVVKEMKTDKDFDNIKTTERFNRLADQEI